MEPAENPNERVYTFLSGNSLIRLGSVELTEKSGNRVDRLQIPTCFPSTVSLELAWFCESRNPGSPLATPTGIRAGGGWRRCDGDDSRCVDYSRALQPVRPLMWTQGLRCLAGCTARARALPQRSTLQTLPWTRTPQRVAGALPSRIAECDWTEARRWFATDVDDDDVDDGASRRRPRPRLLVFALSVASSLRQLTGPSLADGAADGDNPIVKRKKKLDENFYGIVHIQATFNNTIVNITDVTGATLCW
jgi:hypothetical protein